MDDVFSVLSRLPSLDESYTQIDQYSDFRLVFFGTDQGQRVLRRILELGRVFSDPPLASPIDPHMESVHRGERRLALAILAMAQTEPKPKPQTAKRK